MNANIITVFNTKGGVGKTFVAANLAVSLSAKQKKVLLLDFDLQATQDLARMINVKPGPSIEDLFHFGHAINEPSFIQQKATQYAPGVDFFSCVGSIDQATQIDQENIKLFIKQAALAYDYVVVDGGKSFTETLITVLDHTNLILLVTTPDVLSVYQAKWSLSVLEGLHFPTQIIRLVLNRSQSRGGVASQEVRSVLPCEIFAQIPSDGKEVGFALNKGVPCVLNSPHSAIADAFDKVSDSLIKSKDLFIRGTSVLGFRSRKDSGQDHAFWEKFGISKQLTDSQEVVAVVREGDDIIKLKQAVHEKLVERLNLGNINSDALRDPTQAKRIRESTEKVIGDLLAEEAGAIISSHDERRRLVKEIADETLGLGPLEEFLADPDVTDIMVNNKDELYIEKGGKIILTEKKFISNGQIRSIIERIIAPLGRRIDESVPMVDARLPDGSRINAIIPPLSLKGPMLTIRKFGQEEITVNDLLQTYHTLSQPMVEFLKACVLMRKNIIISGGTGAGKTTLLNVISSFIPDNERIITIEDAAELKLRQRHWARLESRPPNVEGKGAITIRDLFINCLRMRPDRIIIGECRGPEILDMLQAMNTGHDGSMTTLHANSTRDVMVRMSSMILLSGLDLPLKAIYEMISTAIHVIVHVSRFSDGTRRITGITEVAGLDETRDLILKDVFVFEQQGVNSDGRVLGEHKPCGYLPVCFEDFVKRGIQIDPKIFGV